jgi:hypothetical protein
VGARQPSQPRWRGYLGPPNSWRRVVLTGIGGGVALALFAAIVMAVVDSAGTSSVSSTQPTDSPPASAGNATAGNNQATVPADTPIAAQPKVAESTDVPVDTPAKERPARTPTPEEVVPTHTPVPKATPAL